MSLPDTDPLPSPSFFTQAAEESRKTQCEVKRIRLDGCKEDFDQRWGYLALESIKENVIQHSPYGEFSTVEPIKGPHLGILLPLNYVKYVHWLT